VLGCWQGRTHRGALQAWSRVIPRLASPAFLFGAKQSRHDNREQETVTEKVISCAH
jgi:hypothetical protein